MSFWCLQILPKNEQKQVDLRYHSNKVEFIRSFFGRIHGLTICFRGLLTFRKNLTILFCLSCCWYSIYYAVWWLTWCGKIRLLSFLSQQNTCCLSIFLLNWGFIYNNYVNHSFVYSLVNSLLRLCAHIT